MLDQGEKAPLMLYESSREHRVEVGGKGAAEIVSIITRTKDRPVLLPRALASVLSQEFTDWHLYLVNDGGDRAVVEAILADYEAAFSGRITVIHNADGLGMEAASNAGLSLARGDYFTIHDDDDSWHPEFLARTVELLRSPANAGYVGVCTNCHIVNERIVGDRVIEDSLSTWGYFQRHIDMRNLLVRNSMPPITVLFRRSLLKDVAGFNPSLPVLGDWEFSLRALTLGDIAVIDEPLAYYHHRQPAAGAQYGNSVSHGVDRHQKFDVLLRNSAIRHALRADPSLVGILQPILHAVDELSGRVSELQQQNGRLMEALSERQSQVGDSRRRGEAGSYRRVLSYDEMRDLAKEVWWERNRRTLLYKLMRVVKAWLRK